MKFRPVEAELFQADGLTDRQTDTRKLKIHFCNFAKAPKDCYVPRTTVKEFTV